MPMPRPSAPLRASSRRPRRATDGPPRMPRAGVSGWERRSSRGSASSARPSSMRSFSAVRTRASRTWWSGRDCRRKSSSGRSASAGSIRWGDRDANSSGGSARSRARHAVGSTAGRSGPAPRGARPPAGPSGCGSRQPRRRSSRRSPRPNGWRRVRGGRARCPKAGRGPLPRRAGPDGVISNADLAARRPGRIRIGGLVVTRQHPMTAKGTVFLALEDETGMVNVTLWPDTWARLRGVVRRHALLLVDGELSAKPRWSTSLPTTFGRSWRPPGTRAARSAPTGFDSWATRE